jgi:hypothetical protein
MRCKENDLEQVGIPVPVPLGGGTDSEVRGGGRGVSLTCTVGRSSRRIVRTKSVEWRLQEGPGSIVQRMYPHRKGRWDGHPRTGTSWWEPTKQVSMGKALAGGDWLCHTAYAYTQTGRRNGRISIAPCARWQ